MSAWIALSLAIIAEVIATSALPASVGFTRLGPSLLVLSAYGAAFYFLSLALQAIPLGVAYAIWSGVGVALISILGYLLYQQKLDLAAMLGIGLICAGVVVTQLFSTSRH